LNDTRDGVIVGFSRDTNGQLEAVDNVLTN